MVDPGLRIVDTIHYMACVSQMLMTHPIDITLTSAQHIHSCHLGLGDTDESARLRSNIVVLDDAHADRTDCYDSRCIGGCKWKWRDGEDGNRQVSDFVLRYHATDIDSGGGSAEG
jgi:hypothetical protein